MSRVLRFIAVLIALSINAQTFGLSALADVSPTPTPAVQPATAVPPSPATATPSPVVTPAPVPTREPVAVPTRTPLILATPAPIQATPVVQRIPGATVVLVPGGTTVVVSLTESISSASANKGDLVPIVVKQPVVAGGFIVVPAGANGQAEVTDVDRAGGNGHGGKIALTMDWVFSADGGKIQLSNVNHNSEKGDQHGASSTATIVTYLLLGPLGLFAHNFVRGKDVTIDPSKTFSIFVDHDVHVQATQRATSPSGFDQ